jgi:DNA-binding XRE family transcriptional regulator
MLVAVKRPRINVEVHGAGEALVAKLLKERYPAAEVSEDRETVRYRDTAFARQMQRESTPGRRLWVYRDNAGLTLEQLARACGIAKTHLSEMENGRRAIGVRTAVKLGKALSSDYRRFL